MDNQNNKQPEDIFENVGPNSVIKNKEAVEVGFQQTSNKPSRKVKAHKEGDGIINGQTKKKNMFYKLKFNKNIILILVFFLLFLSVNSVESAVGSLWEDLSTEGKLILDQSENDTMLSFQENRCDSFFEQERNECFDKLDFTIILLLGRADLCNQLVFFRDNCYKTEAFILDDITLCDDIDNNAMQDECRYILIQRDAIRNNDITLCDGINDISIRHDCRMAVVHHQDDISFCDTAFIVNNNLVDECQSIISTNYAMTDNDIIYCEQVPLQSYRDICFIEFGYFCGDNICTNIFENISSCPNDCYICGDGKKTPPNEQCDDGIINNGQYGYCKSDCSGMGDYCGDYVVNDPPEICEQNEDPISCTVNGYAGNKTCNSDCLAYSNCIAIEWCGDGTVNTPEQCDDSGTIPNDGCSSICVVETGWKCFGEPSVCEEICGDGNIVGDEVCDDNNTEPCDECSSDCLRIDNDCGDGIPECDEDCDDDNPNNNDDCLDTCVSASCGDGYIWSQDAGDEVCDDGGTIPNDGCSPICQVEYGWSCSGEPSVCVLLCGNGDDTDPGEDCDDGNSSNNDSCLNDCTSASCGDGYVEFGVEYCDFNTSYGSTNCDTSCDLVDNCTTEYCALSALFKDTNGQNWRDNTNWLSDLSFDQWYGVSTLDNGNVESLRLYRNLLNGLIPSEIVNLTDLRELSLSSNQISDISGLSGFTNLHYLSLSDNQISDISPLSGLASVHNLWLNANQISDISSLSGLTNLNSLYLQYNNISDISALNSFINLGSLKIDNNIIQNIPFDICNDLNINNLLSLEKNEFGTGSCTVMQCLVAKNISQFSYNPQQNGAFEYFDDCVAVCGDGDVWGDEECDPPGLTLTSILEQQKLLASDGSIHDFFGGSISIDGDYMVIGARMDDDNGSNSGSAYVFEKPAGGWANMTQTAKLLASDGSLDDRFGGSISIDGDYMVIGARMDDDNGSNSGSAYVFKYNTDTNTWSQQAKLLAINNAFQHYFGVSVSIDGDYIVIGATGTRENGSWTGSAYVFKRDIITDTWSQQAKLNASDGAYRDYFGGFVSIDGDYIVIGAAGDDDDGESGSAYVFKYNTDTNTWSQQAKLLASDGADGDYFGHPVSIDGDYIVIGAETDDDNGLKSGSAYVFRNGCVMLDGSIGVKTCDGSCMWGCQ